MKKFMLILSVMTYLSLSMTDASAQNHRHTPRTNVKVTAVTNKDTASVGIEAFSDTTSTTDSAAYDDEPIDEAFTYGMSADSDIKELGEIAKAFGAFMVPIVIVAILFIFAPAIIIFIICFFIYKNRKQKLKIAEMAIKNGQPIPDSILGYSTRKARDNSNNTTAGNQTSAQAPSANKLNLSSMPADDQLWRRGVMHIFVGIGLMFLLDAIMGNFGFSIGVLVTLYGAGQAFIAWTSNRNTNGTGQMTEDSENSDNTTGTDIDKTEDRWGK